MTIRDFDDRTIITGDNLNIKPYDSVVAVDTDIPRVDSNKEQAPARGSGIVIGPNHVLTNYHVIYNNYQTNPKGVRITLAENVESLPPRSQTTLTSSDYNVDLESEAKQSPIFAVSSSKPKAATSIGSLAEDVGVLKLTNPVDGSKPIGLIRYTNPQDLVNKIDVSTAGYPGVVPLSNLQRSKNTQFISTDDNGELLQGTPDIRVLEKNFLQRWLGLRPTKFTANQYITDATKLFAATGTIESATDSEIRLSSSIDLEAGQSGSGIWTTLEGDSEPRILAALAGSTSDTTDGGITKNTGALINEQIYDGITKIMDDPSTSDDGNSLPENAIVGSDSLDDLVNGTYRRERILGKDGVDILYGMEGDDRLEGGNDNDFLDGGKNDDLLEGGSGNDFLDGGDDDDVAVYFDSYTDANGNPNYDISTNTNTKVTTITHLNGGIDGTDTLKNVEFAQFKGGQQEPLAFIPQGGEDEFGNQTFVAADSAEASRPRIIPLPLEDGVEKTESVEVTGETYNLRSYKLPTQASVSLTAPVSMLDGDIDYTLDISPYDPSSEYNIVYIVDTSASMDAGELQTVKNAYEDLINYHIDSGLAENGNFGVVQFSTNATPYFNLTPSEAISTIQGLTTSSNQGTVYDGSLSEGLNFLDQSSSDVLNTNNIVYFVSGDTSNKVSYFPTFFGTTTQNDYNSYFEEAERLKDYAKVQAFGFDNALPQQIDDVDSDDGVMLSSAGDLSTELLKSGLRGEVESVNILLDGEVIDTLTPNQFTNNPAGLSYEGSLDELDVSIDAENVITAEVVFTPASNLANTTVEHTVTAGKGEVVDANGNPIDESGNTSGDEDPFEKTRNGGDGNDDITLGYVDKGASGGAGGDKIVGNNRDNILDGGAGNDTIFGHGGDDTITTGVGTDKVDGGEGVDTVVYEDIVYGDGSSITLNKIGTTVRYANQDSLTDVEFIQFSDVRVSAETLEVTPVIEVSDISVVEGNAGNTTATFTFELSTPAPVDVVFDYSTADVEAVAGSDYVAKSETLTIPAGDTTATVDVDVIGDSSYYDLPIETFALNLSGLSGATFTDNRTEYTVSATIENDDKFGINPEYIFRTNAGGDNYFDTDFQPWSQSSGFVGAGTFSSQNAIEQTEDDVLYQSEHFGSNFDYQQAVANGSYDVTLKFAEVFFNSAGRRVFDVTAEDQTALNDFDIFAEAGGKNIATDRTFTVDVNDGLLDLGFNSSVDNAKVSAIKVVPTASSLSINAGGADYTDTETNQWLKSEGFRGGNTFSSSNAIAQTEDDVLYQSERFGQEFAYNLAVENGSYDITLKFAEVFFNQAGKRVFDVTAEDEVILDDFDIYSSAGGKNIAVDRTFTVDVNDGSLDLDFDGSVDNAKVSAIKIEPTPFIETPRPTIRTNAGGNAYTDMRNRSWLESSGFVGAGTFTRANPIAQTEDDVLYQSEAFGNNFDYQQEVENGSYDVTLKFAEVFFNNAGQRVFDVTAEGQTVLDDFDIVESAGGKNIAVDRTFNVNVTDGSIDLGFLSSVDKAKVSAIEIKPTLPQFRTNAGGEAYTDLGGQSWLESSGFVGAGTFTRANAIAQTEDDVLYQSEAVGNNFDYQQEVANGSYDVTLKFAEVFFNNPGQRVFDVNLEGQTVLDDFDIVESAGGKNIAVDRTFNVNVTDGSIDLGFLSSVDKAKVSAIEIKPNNPSFRTNAGGEAYTDISGQSWLMSDGFVGAGTFTRANPIAQTEDDVLYQSEAVGNNFSYQQEVENGSYDVTLKFAEVFFNNAGQRVFDVRAEGQTVLDDFDIVESAGGKNIAVDRTFTVGVSDGTLDLDFIASIDNAKVSAIEIKPSLI